jgi:glycosyltransferase involved in cell wall biosynthesis
MKDFVPNAIHFPFFAPGLSMLDDTIQTRNFPKQGEIKIVHVTNHPGIEGTEYIQQAIQNLKKKGYSLNFVFLQGVSHNQVMKEHKDADLAIGKLKMGYYANAQIESMALGVPTITYVRPQFMTEELETSGFIFSTPDELEATLQFYLDHPEELEKKRRIARKTILQLHDNSVLVKRLMELYDQLREN